MEINNILNKISAKIGKSPEEIRQSNIDDIFEKGPSSEGGYRACIVELMNYVKKELGENYYVGFAGEPEGDITTPDFRDVYLVKSLKYAHLEKEDIHVVELHELKSTILTLDLESMGMKDFAYNDDPEVFFEEFRNVGDILEKIKKIYEDGGIDYRVYAQLVLEKMEAYLVTLEPRDRIVFVTSEIQDTDFAGYLDENIIRKLRSIALSS